MVVSKTIDGSSILSVPAKNVGVAERSGGGLQNRLNRFNSYRRLKNIRQNLSVLMF